MIGQPERITAVAYIHVHSMRRVAVTMWFPADCEDGALWMTCGLRIAVKIAS